MSKIKCPECKMIWSDEVDFSHCDCGFPVDQMFNVIATKKIIVHAGANDGEEYFKRKWLKDSDIEINLFEPIPELARDLRKKFDGWNNVCIIEAALTNDEGPVDFWLSENIPGSSVFEGKKNLNNPEKIRVNSWEAGSFLRGLVLHGNKIALNLNCEGSEFLILPRLFEEDLWGSIAALRIEWHHQSHRLPYFESEYVALSQALSIGNAQILDQDEWFEFVKDWT